MSGRFAPVLAALAALALAAAALAQPGAPPSGEVTPEGPPPSGAPPPPSGTPLPPPDVGWQAAPPPGMPPGGQWVYTSEYGWVWMPYGHRYVYAPEGQGLQPYVYLYAPSLGWRWLVAPWVRGVGPRPYVGRLGPWRYPWYGAYRWPRAYGRPIYRWSPPPRFVLPGYRAPAPRPLPPHVHPVPRAPPHPAPRPVPAPSHRAGAHR